MQSVQCRQMHYINSIFMSGFKNESLWCNIIIIIFQINSDLTIVFFLILTFWYSMTDLEFVTSETNDVTWAMQKYVVTLTTPYKLTLVSRVGSIFITDRIQWNINLSRPAGFIWSLSPLIMSRNGRMQGLPNLFSYEYCFSLWLEWWWGRRGMHSN